MERKREREKERFSFCKLIGYVFVGEKMAVLLSNSSFFQVASELTARSNPTTPFTLYLCSALLVNVWLVKYVRLNVTSSSCLLLLRLL